MKNESTKLSNILNIKPSCHIINIDKIKGRNNASKRINTNSLEKTQIVKTFKSGLNEKLLLFSVYDNRLNENSKRNETKQEVKSKDNPIKKDVRSSFNNSKEKNEKLASKLKNDKICFNNTFINNKSNIQTTYYTNKINNSEISKKYKTFLNDNKINHVRQDSKLSENNQNNSFFNSEKQKNLNKSLSKKINPRNLKNSFAYNKSLINKVKESDSSIPIGQNVVAFQKIEEGKKQCLQLSTENLNPYSLYETEPNKTFNFMNQQSLSSQLSPVPIYNKLEDKFNKLYKKNVGNEKELLLYNLNVIRKVFEEYVQLNTKEDSKTILSHLLTGFNESYRIAQNVLIDRSKLSKIEETQSKETLPRFENELKISKGIEGKSISSKCTLNNESLEIMGEHNKNITKINQNNIDDLEAIYFFDKVEMRSKSHAEPKVPKLNINFAIEKYQQMQQAKKHQLDNHDKFLSPQEKIIQLKENLPTVQPVNNKLSHKKKNSLFNFTPETALEKEIKNNRVSNFSTKVSSSTTSIVNEINVFKKHI